MKKFIAILLIMSFGSVFILDVYPIALDRDNEENRLASFVTAIQNLRLFDQYEKKWPVRLETSQQDPGLFDHDDYYNNEILKEGYFSLQENAPDQMQIKHKPKLSNRKIVGEFLAGIAGGFVLGSIVGLIAASSYHFDESDSDMKALAFFFGYIPGSIFGSAIGVSLAGNSRNIRGSFFKALIGVFFGGVFAAAVTTCLIHVGGRMVGFLSSMASLTFPTIGAMLLFNSSLKYKSLPGYALLNFDKGKFNIGVPYIQIQPQFHFTASEKRSFMINVNLMNITF